MKEIALVGMTAQMSGVEFSTLYLARGLDRTQWRPLIICPEEGALTERCRALGLETRILPRPRLFSTSVRVAGHVIVNPFALIANVVALVAAAIPLARFLRQRAPALVVTKGLLVHFYGGLAAKLAGIPCVWHVQDRVSERVGPLFAWTLGMAGRWLARDVIVDAESIAKQLRPIVPERRIAVIWNGVDVEEFSPRVDGSRARAEWGAGKDDLLIGVVGRLTPWKGQRVLIDAFAQIASEVPQARGVIVGAALFETDVYARELHAQVQRLGLHDRVLFVGHRWDLPQVLAALDIVVHTSVEKDSSPLAVVSAMASGKPIICSSVEGTAQLFDSGKDGVLVPPGDVNALAEELRRLLRDPRRRSDLGRAARKKAEGELSLEHFVQQSAAVFSRALA